MQIRLRVKPGQRTDGLWRDSEEQGDILVAHIRAAPKDGEANAYLEKYLAEQLGVPKSLVRVTKGGASRFKTVEIDVSYSDVMASLSHIPPLPKM